MSAENPLPHRLILLGKTLQGVLGNLKDKLGGAPLPAAAGENPFDALGDVLERYRLAIQDLTAAVNALMPDVVENESASDADVYRAAARIEVVLARLLRQYGEALDGQLLGLEPETDDLLAGGLRHTLDEVLAWLEEVVEVLTDPLAALKRRGLPTEGQVELPLELKLTSPPQFSLLGQGGRGYVPASAHPRRQSVKSSKGLRLLGWLGLIWLGSELFGDDCDRKDGS